MKNLFIILMVSFFAITGCTQKTDDASASIAPSATPDVPLSDMPKEKYKIETEKYLLTFETTKDLMVKLGSDQARIGMDEPDVMFNLTIIELDKSVSDSGFGEYLKTTFMISEMDPSLVFEDPYPYEVGNRKGKAIDFVGEEMIGRSVFVPLDDEYFFWAWGFGDIRGGTDWDIGSQLFNDVLNSVVVQEISP